MTPTEETVRRLASDVLDVPTARLTRESSPDTVETWDSVAHLSLILAVEQELGITFNLDELDAMTSVGAIATTADRYLQPS